MPLHRSPTSPSQRGGFKTPKSKAVLALISILVASVATAVAAQASPHTGQSEDVGIISDPLVINGGSLPTTTSGPTGSFNDFNFTNVPVASVNSTTLAAFDTVVLNVASPGMACDADTLSASQKTSLRNFLTAGGKLIIYDSECGPESYPWLPEPFTTQSPGQTGSTGGTVNIVEDNLLGADTSGNVHFINEGLLAQQTDAVGDMQVLTTQDPQICLHMSGTNAANQTGATHVYYQSGSGLLIYNGFDVDFMGSSTSPNASDGAGNLAKIWLQELQQPLNGQGLACAVVVTGIALDPQQATNPVGARHTLTATVTNQGNPSPNTLVTFNVTGANAGASGTCSPANCRTGANGQVTFTYTGSRSGQDQIRACFTQGGNQVCSARATKTWTGGPSGGPVWEAFHTLPGTTCSARVQQPYLDSNQQVTSYTQVVCQQETRLTIRSRLRSDHRFDRPVFRNITVAQIGCVRATCVVDQPAGTRFYKLTCPRSSSRTSNQDYFTDIIMFPGTDKSAATPPFPQRSRPATLSPFCAS